MTVLTVQYLNHHLNNNNKKILKVSYAANIFWNLRKSFRKHIHVCAVEI